MKRVGRGCPPPPGVRPHHCATVASGPAKNELRNYFLGMESVFGNCEKLTENLLLLFFLRGSRGFRKASKMLALLANFDDAKDRWLSKPKRNRGWVLQNCCMMHASSPIGLSSVFRFTSLGNSPRMADLPALLMNFNILTKGTSGKQKNLKNSFFWWDASKC